MGDSYSKATRRRKSEDDTQKEGERMVYYLECVDDWLAIFEHSHVAHHTHISVVSDVSLHILVRVDIAADDGDG